MTKQAKLIILNFAQIYYVFEVLKDYAHAVEVDQINWKYKWQDAIQLKMNHLAKYETFKDLASTNQLPDGYKKVCMHIMQKVKRDECHTARHVMAILLKTHWTVCTRKFSPCMELDWRSSLRS